MRRPAHVHVGQKRFWQRSFRVDASVAGVDMEGEGHRKPTSLQGFEEQWKGGQAREFSLRKLATQADPGMNRSFANP